jgi:hypothetical protein
LLFEGLGPGSPVGCVAGAVVDGASNGFEVFGGPPGQVVPFGKYCRNSPFDAPMTLLCLVKGQVGPVFLLGCRRWGLGGSVGVGRGGWFEELVELAGEGAFEAAFGFSDGFAFAGSAGDVGAGGGVDPGSG